MHSDEYSLFLFTV